MLGKLARRNARRAMKDYLIYLITMILITALMFAFNSMIFSPAIIRLCTQEAGVMGALLGLVTGFIVLIVVWLVHYMVKFMAQKRSREFGTYLLLGFHKKQIANLFLRENMLIGAAAFIIGLVPGMFLQQVITTLIYAMMNRSYALELDINAGTFLMTGGVYLLSFLLALFRNKSRFRKMNIHDMLYLERENEQLGGGSKSGKKWMLGTAVLYIAFFFYMLYAEKLTVANVFPMTGGVIIAVYMLFAGLSGVLVSYINKGGKRIYSGADVFILRQLASKVKTMQFTLGTLTVLFTVALVGYACAFMLNQYQNSQASEQWPFDVAIFSKDSKEAFQEELAYLDKKVTLKDRHIYRMYENHTGEMGHYMKKQQEEKGLDDTYYFQYDTYMRLSDYNYLRRMLGYQNVVLKDGEYALHMKNRPDLVKIGNEFAKQNKITAGGKTLGFSGMYTEGFEQSGHNGADFVLVVPDHTAEQMTPYYSLLMAQTKGKVPENLESKLLKIVDEVNVYEDWATGTGTIYVSDSQVNVRENQTQTMQFVLSSLIFPLFYVGLVFLCVALTVLSVQQLSDSDKYKYRYQVLKKLGLREHEVNKVILKQLAVYYLCPFISAFLLSLGISGYIGNNFVLYSGIDSSSLVYMGIATVVFGLVYLLYFLITYEQFKRNIRFG